MKKPWQLLLLAPALALLAACGSTHGGTTGKASDAPSAVSSAFAALQHNPKFQRDEAKFKVTAQTCYVHVHGPERLLFHPVDTYHAWVGCAAPEGSGRAVFACFKPLAEHNGVIPGVSFKDDELSLAGCAAQYEVQHDHG